MIVIPGPIDAALAYAARVANRMTWYSTADSPAGADVDAPLGGGFALNLFRRVGDTVYRTWHTSDRGVEQLTHTFALVDILPYGRRQLGRLAPVPTYSRWLDSPDAGRLCGPQR